MFLGVYAQPQQRLLEQDFSVPVVHGHVLHAFLLAVHSVDLEHVHHRSVDELGASLLEKSDRLVSLPLLLGEALPLV